MSIEDKLALLGRKADQAPPPEKMPDAFMRAIERGHDKNDLAEWVEVMWCALWRDIRDTGSMSRDEAWATFRSLVAVSELLIAAHFAAH